MTDIAFLVYAVALLALIGVPAALLLPPGLPARLSLAPVLGYCSLAILSPNLFQAGLAVRQQLWLYGGLAAVGLACLARRAHRGGKRLGWRRAESLRLGAAWALAAILLSLPKWVAGEQYYAYLGNILDYFNYATAGALFAKLSPAELQLSSLAGPAAVLHNPMLLLLSAINLRPSAVLVFSALADPFLSYKVPLFELANAYMSLTLSLYLFSLYFLLSFATSAGPAARVLIPLVFVCGFWGGYLINVDAWSQLAAVMLMPALFALGLAPLSTGSQAGAGAGGGRLLRLGLGMALVVGAAVYLYPEMVPVYAPIYTASLLVSLLAGGWNGHRLIPQFIAASVGLLLALPYFQGTLGFLGHQLHLIASDPELSAAWFRYFHGFLLGGDDLDTFARASGWDWTRIAKTLGAGANFAGLYRVVPEASEPMWMQSVDTIGGLLAALGWCALRSLRMRTLWLPAGLLAGVAIVIALAEHGNLYGAGKTFFWLSPFILVLLLLPLADPRARWWQRLPASIYVALQAISLIIRLANVATGHGIPGAPPYPGDQYPARKWTIEINLARLFDRLDGCRLVRVDLEDPLLRHYVMVNLFARDIPYFSVQPINSNYGAGTDLGVQRPVGAPDCTVRLGAPGTSSSGRQALVVEPAAG